MSGAPNAISCDFSLLERNVSSKNAQLNLHNLIVVGEGGEP
jgi:hypothetical protein